MTKEQAKEILWNRCQHTPETAEAIRVLSEERQQGEWIDYSEEGYVECPFCEHLTNCEDNIDELHYCWNCGAYMQKGGSNG